MRYQERIYAQDCRGVRNKDIFNVNMSSDMCVFESPLYTMSGASKLDCSTGATSGTSYIISGNSQQIPLTFSFTANTDTFIETDAQFKFNLFQYNQSLSSFTNSSVYKSESISYSAFSGTNITTFNVPSSALTLDGEFIIKSSFVYSACTDFLFRLGKSVDTVQYLNGDQYGFYDNNLDYYFIAMREADTPIFTENTSNIGAVNKLIQNVILPEVGQTIVIIPSTIVGDFVLTFNGIVLAPNLDYTFTGNTVTLFEEIVADDTITVTYTTAGGNNLVGDYINILTPIISGITDGQGSNEAYFNTTTGKYEVYTSVTPQTGNDIMIMLNGTTLANNIDYYQSISNPKRIILEGVIQVDDIVTIIYFPLISVVNGLNTNTPTISWLINNPPTQINGFFTLEVSYDNGFVSPYYSGVTDYIIDNTIYSATFIATGTVGTNLFYRVKNTKNYTTICGDILTSNKYSETIPITIQTNSINSY